MNSRTNRTSDPAQAAELRRQAEERLLASQPEAADVMSPADARALVHELQVHQIELEMQNEELQRARLEAEEAREKYYELFDFSPAGHFLWDHDGRILELNLAGAALLGVDRSAVSQKQFGQFVAAEFRDAFADFLKRVLATDAKQTCEVKLQTDGVLVWVLVEGIAAPGPPEAQRRCRAAVVDITEQKRADDLATANRELQAAQRRAETFRDRYVDLYDHAPLGYVTLDEEGFIQEINLAGAAMLGRDRAELTGYEFAEHVAAADRTTFQEHVRQCCGKHQEATSELDLIAGQGRSITVQIHSIPVEADGHEGTFTKTAIADITERKRAEEAVRESENRYRSLFENMLDGFIYCRMLFDESGRPDDVLLLEVNRAFEKLTGLENVAGKRATEIIPQIKSSNPELLENCGRVVSTGKAETFDVDFTPLGKWFSLSVYSQGHADFIIVFDDITQRIRLMESLEQNARAAQAANETKSQFLANVSHELRTPMNAILGMIDVAPPKAADPFVQDCLETARGSADLLLTLLNDLLDSAKIESGKLELKAAPFSLRRMLDQLTGVLAIQASEKELALASRCSDELPDGFVGDRTRLQQVLLNLAGNAIKFTERGEVQISVRGAKPSQGEETAALEFAVRDTGIGIPPAEQQRLFRPFVQVDASTMRHFGGTGLGLSICKGLVELMGGRIWLESELGRGSSFHFTVVLPLANEPPADDGTSLVLPPRTVGPLRILLTEDNLANQKLVDYVLRGRGHQVEIAGEGEEAVYLSERNSYDVILMDVQMPGMDGMEATAAIRQRESEGRRVPIIAMTAHAMQSDRERCLAAGMDAYLVKPVNGRELIGLVESLAQGKPIEDPVFDRPGELDVAAPAPARVEPRDGIAVFDAEKAIEHCFNSHEMLDSMIQNFFAEVDDLLAQMRRALESGDLSEVGRLGHSLKGTLVYLGAESAAEAASLVEHFTPAAAEGAVDALERRCIALKAALRHPSERARPPAALR